MHKTNQLWNFFASVKLAIFTLSALSLTSIIGTIIPQHKPVEFYMQKYGSGAARFMEVLDIPDMYGSWWFLTLLLLLAVNLIICSIDRFPAAWKQIKADPADISLNKLQSMPFSSSVSSGQARDQQHAESALTKHGFRVEHRETENGHLIAGQKGAWSRTGVYIVHLSILVIFTGALVGHFLGAKGSVMIPETKKSSKIYAPISGKALDLGFEVRCDLFEIEFYDNGMPKDYRSRLTILEDGEVISTTPIEVNHPLKYKGYTFYQSSYEGYRDFVFTVTDNSSGEQKSFIAPFQEQVEWSDKNLIFGVVNAKAFRDRVVELKVWFKEGDKEPVVDWVKDRDTLALDENPPFTITAKQMYATGLQVAKDPGVWIVYLGCGLMMVGLYMAFFLSHKRVWVLIQSHSSSSPTLLAGSTNKNKIGFEKIFAEIESALKG